MLRDHAALDRRREEVRASPTLGALAERLNRQLDPLREDGIYFPSDRAALTRQGGVCPDDGSRLVFHPLRPREHTCPVCHRIVTGDLHHRAWVWRYHLWLSERAVHAALLHRLGLADDGRALAVAILDAYATRYHDFPNQDNVLGPTRLFFSTYLESIWLLQVTVAAGLLVADAGDTPSMRFEVEDMVSESAKIIQSFDEAFSNRQVWNNAAMIAAGLFLDDDALVEHAVAGDHGVVAALNRAVAPNGRWAEGENYHFFALRGFQLAAELLRGAGVDLYADPHTTRLTAMYGAPLLTLLPDLTFPARGDSPYGVSIRQPRFAELWEVARSRVGDRFDPLLAAMYRGEPGPDVGLEEIAEVEFHRPGAGLRRDRLGWRALLWMLPEDPVAVGDVDLPFGVVEPRGPAVIRNGPARYAALETGTGAGHGHPDALHLTVFDELPILTDPGTGSYVSPSLHWYRSTLAHNAPGVAGVGQSSAIGWCSAYEVRDGVGWAQATVEGAAGASSTLRRSIVLTDDILVDVVDVRVPDGVTLDLPLHLRGEWSMAEADLAAARPQDRVDARGLETGYDVVEVTGRVTPPVRIEGGTGARPWSVLLPPREGETILAVKAPGPPSLVFADGAVGPALIRRGTGSGRWVSVLAAGRPASAVTVDGDTVVVQYGAESMTVVVGEEEARVGTGTDAVRLAGRRSAPAKAKGTRVASPQVWCPLLVPAPRIDRSVETLPWNAVHPLREMHYRRSEQPYPGVDRFSARFGVWATGNRLFFVADVRKADLTWWNPAVDPELDNENPAIHADGLQFYWAMPDPPGGRSPWRGCLVLPQADGSVRIEGVRGLGEVSDVEASWMRTTAGYRVMGSCPADRALRPGDHLRVNVAVNEMRPGRIRRAGQLVFHGGGGWTYLRGDREPMHAAAVAEVR